MNGLVVREGRGATLQDGGRRGMARYGVPRSGPVDGLSFRLAARLAGVAPDAVHTATAVEVGPRGARFEAAGTLTVAVCGHATTVQLERSTVPAPCVIPLGDGDAFEVAPTTWAYVVPTAPLQVVPVLGSTSHHPRSGLGPALSDGDTLGLGTPRPVRVGRRRAPPPASGSLGVLPAPQTHLFTARSRQVLVEEEWATTSSFDRMGHRLDGPRLEAADGHDIVSDGVVPGTLQVPGDGRPYVLTADHQTTGGYPKVAVLGTAALAAFVRRPPGSPVRFHWSTVEQARAELVAAHAAVERTVQGPVTPLAATLQGSNLIGGVTDGD